MKSVDSLEELAASLALNYNAVCQFNSLEKLIHDYYRRIERC